MSNPAETQPEHDRQTPSGAHEGRAPTDKPEGDGARSVPESPTGLPRRRWPAIFKRTFKSYQSDNVGDLAAALTYYGIQAIFPALIALVSIIGLIGQSATKALISNLEKLAPGTAQHIFRNAIHGLQSSRGTAGILFIVGLAGALWSASGYISAFTRAANTIYGVEEGRPIYKTIPLRLGLTVVMMLLLAISSFAVVLTGGLAGRAGQLLGIGSTAVSVWDIAKWPVLLLIVAAMISILYWAAPNVKHPGFSWLSPGGIFAVVIWLIASGLFALYVANFSSYNKTYGSLAAVIIFLIWLWVTNVAILFGVELNNELYRGRELEAGRPADHEPFVEPRQAKKD
ncbi:MAG: YihY/virulence factor BrkB family protein [Actinomycetota bacterium]|nr:YihY/virulence factor BrkB family protein [Actinomycetota bacterium]